MKKITLTDRAAFIYCLLYPINFVMAFMLGEKNYVLGGILMVVIIIMEWVNIHMMIKAQTEDINNT